ncbi:hypothetical protein M422DRAFT_193469 [Sphaerobolus stellatus SS14]|uniref:Uncharacterized protein n=1 Tax=Sphaerobolus stellatus (strain SS14) TaxID=990650 RepID=A0A0C9U8T4_SPHS4|nr:hypothetical protein M422DRAFT_193469 [Sphaerobolus stellatus SS14]
MHPKDTKVIRLSNDRPNVVFQMHKMCVFANSYQDLGFLIPSDSSPENPPHPFMVFTNSRTTTVDATKYLHYRLTSISLRYHNKVVWFHAGMTDIFKDYMIEKLRMGYLWGIACTEVAGMVCVPQLLMPLNIFTTD